MLICTAALLFPVTASASDGSSTLLERYSDRLSKGAHDKLSVAVEIEASLPGLECKSACAAAIRRSRNGKSEYEFISAEGDPVRSKRDHCALLRHRHRFPCGGDYEVELVPL